MLTDRLYPPNIAGTIPSFTQGTSLLEVPFFMNIAVSKSEVQGLKLRLSTTATDIVLGDINSSSWNETSATFQLDTVITSKLILGDYYKVQLAYVAASGVTGYYSTVAIMKYTAQPAVKIDGLSSLTTTVTANAFIGTYQNSDTSEKVYKYKFDLSDDKDGVVILESSDWQIHNINNDTELGKSNDSWTFRHNLTGEKPFYVKYSITTNNGLIVSTQIYPVQLSVSTTTLNLNLAAKLDYENGRVILSTTPTTNKAINLNTHYMFMRASSKDDFSTWEVLRDIIPEVIIQSWAPYTFWDYSVEAGVEYQYSVQSYDANRVFSKRIVSNKVQAWFEDVFLYDGEKQLRIQFNPQVNSFKRTISETKKTTLGRKYPFILRSGIVDYKEFSIGGLVSYLTDKDELFVNKKEMFINWNGIETTDLTDENYAWEKTFRYEVLNWLNNGELKLFRSPQEGNYVVRLMNVNLTPDAVTNRLINSFTCSASEMGESDLTSLRELSLINNTEYAPIPEIDIIVDLYDILQNLFYEDDRKTQQEAIDEMKEIDLSKGLPCRKIKFYHRSDIVNSQGMIFNWGNYTLTIDAYSENEIELDNFVINKLSITNPNFINTQNACLRLTVPATLFNKG